METATRKAASLKSWCDGTKRQWTKIQHVTTTTSLWSSAWVHPAPKEHFEANHAELAKRSVNTK